MANGHLYDLKSDLLHNNALHFFSHLVVRKYIFFAHPSFVAHFQFGKKSRFKPKLPEPSMIANCKAVGHRPSAYSGLEKGCKITPKTKIDNFFEKISSLLGSHCLKHSFPRHSLIRGFFIQSCSAGAKNFTNYLFCHPQFSGIIQNIENSLCHFYPYLPMSISIKITNFALMAQRFSIYWITKLNCT